MITGKSFEDYVNRQCRNIDAKFIENENNPHWELLTWDPDEGDEQIVLATLYYNTLMLKIRKIDIYENLMEYMLLCGGIKNYCGDNAFKKLPEEIDEESVEAIYYLLTDEDLFDIVMGFLIEDFTDRIGYLHFIFDNIKSDLIEIEEK